MNKCDNLEDYLNHEIRIFREQEKEHGKMADWDKDDFKSVYFEIIREYYCKTQCTKRIACSTYKGLNSSEEK